MMAWNEVRRPLRDLNKPQHHEHQMFLIIVLLIALGHQAPLTSFASDQNAEHESARDSASPRHWWKELCESASTTEVLKISTTCLERREKALGILA